MAVYCSFILFCVGFFFCPLLLLYSFILNSLHSTSGNLGCIEICSINKIKRKSIGSLSVLGIDPWSSNPETFEPPLPRLGKNKQFPKPWVFFIKIHYGTWTPQSRHMFVYFGLWEKEDTSCMIIDYVIWHTSSTTSHCSSSPSHWILIWISAQDQRLTFLPNLVLPWFLQFLLFLISEGGM